jgi:hypothetical protein
MGKSTKRIEGKLLINFDDDIFDEDNFNEDNFNEDNFNDESDYSCDEEESDSDNLNNSIDYTIINQDDDNPNDIFRSYCFDTDDEVDWENEQYNEQPTQLKQNANIETTKDFFEFNEIATQLLQVKTNDYNKVIRMLNNPKSDIFNFKTDTTNHSYEFLEESNKIKNIQCFDTSKINCLVLYDKNIFDKHIRKFVETDIRNITPYYTSNFDTFEYYFIKVNGHPDDTPITTIKYINNAVCDILCGIGAYCNLNEKIINPFHKPLTISYATLLKIQEELDKLNPNMQVSQYYAFNKTPLDMLNPYHFKENKKIQNYNQSNNIVFNYRGMGCKFKNKEDNEDKDKDKDNHICERKWSGNYYYNNPSHLFRFLLENTKASEYCMTECTTEYFKYFVDLDMNNDVLNTIRTNHANFNYHNYWKSLIDILLETLVYFIDQTTINSPLFEYLYSVKTRANHKIHLNFPRIIINKRYALTIRDKVIEQIKKSNLPLKEHIDVIFDKLPYATSLRLLSQRKCGEKAAYDIDINRSTYKIKGFANYEKYKKKLLKGTITNKGKEELNQTKFAMLHRTSIATNHAEINFKKKLGNNNIPLLDLEVTNEETQIFRSGNKIYSSRRHAKQQQPNNTKESYNGPRLGDNRDINIDITQDATGNSDGTVTLNMPKQCNGVNDIVITIELFAKLLLNLSQKRIEEYIGWLNLEFLCKNYGLYKVAHQISRGEKYNPEYIDKIFDETCKRTKNDGTKYSMFSIFTLLKWSKEDNPEGHEKIMNSNGSLFVKLPSNNINSDRFLKDIEEYGLTSYLIHYQSRYVKNLPIDKALIFLKSGLGTGKTVSDVRACKEMLSELSLTSICNVASRRTLTVSIKNKFVEEGVDMKHYEERGIDYSDPNLKISITPDSLTRFIINIDKTKSRYDINAYTFHSAPQVVCIDEIKSFLWYIALAKTLQGKRIQVFAAFLHIICNAKKLIFMDGHLDVWEIMYIKHLLETNKPEIWKEKTKDMGIIYNSQKTETNNYFSYVDHNELAIKMIRTLEEGKNIFVCTDSRRYADTLGRIIKKYIPDIAMKIFTSNSAEEDKKEIGNCTNSFKKYRVVITSPIMLYGVDFNEEHFHQCFAFYFGIINPRGNHQQILRIRRYIDNMVSIYVKGVNMKSLRNRNNMIQCNNHQKNIEQCMNNVVNTISCKNEYSVKKLFGILDNHCLVDDDTARHYHGLQLLNYLTEYGGSVYYRELNKVNKKDYNDIIKKMTEAKKESLDEYYNNLIIASKNVNSYGEIVDKKDKTSEENYVIIAYRIMHNLGLQSINKQLLTYIGDIHYIDKFRNSLIFSLSDKYYDAVLGKLYDKDFNMLVDRFILKTEIVRTLLLLFFSDGLADNRIRLVSSHYEHLTDEHKAFIKKYKTKINLLFPSLNKDQKKKKRESKVTISHDNIDKDFINYSLPITPKTLMAWLSSMLDDYFGFSCVKAAPANTSNIIDCAKKQIELVTIDYFETKEILIPNNTINPVNYKKSDCDDSENDVCSKKNSTKNKIDFKSLTKRYCYYCYKLDNLPYLELLLNVKKPMLKKMLVDKVQQNFKKIECKFFDLHKSKKFYDLLESTLIGGIRIPNNLHLLDDNEDINESFEYEKVIEDTIGFNNKHNILEAKNTCIAIKLNKN